MSIAYYGPTPPGRTSYSVSTTGTETSAPGSSGAGGGTLGSPFDTQVGTYAVIVEADNTRTLSGAGTAQAWMYIPQLDRWMRATSYDVTVPAGASGQRWWCSAFVAPASVPTGGRLAFMPSGITVSLGGVTIRTMCFAPSGEAI